MQQKISTEMMFRFVLILYRIRKKCLCGKEKNRRVAVFQKYKKETSALPIREHGCPPQFFP